MKQLTPMISLKLRLNALLFATAAAVAHRALADAEQGRPAADHAAGRLVADLAVGKCLLEFGNAHVGDLGASQINRLQA